MSAMGEIRARLDALTPDERDPHKRLKSTLDDWFPPTSSTIRVSDHAAVAFVAHAPGDVAVLLEVLEGVRAAATNPDYGWVDAGVEIERILNDFDHAWLHGEAKAHD